MKTFLLVVLGLLISTTSFAHEQCDETMNALPVGVYLDSHTEDTCVVAWDTLKAYAPAQLHRQCKYLMQYKYNIRTRRGYEQSLQGFKYIVYFTCNMVAPGSKHRPVDFQRL